MILYLPPVKIPSAERRAYSTPLAPPTGKPSAANVPAFGIEKLILGRFFGTKPKDDWLTRGCATSRAIGEIPRLTQFTGQHFSAVSALSLKSL
ncbi:MAG TPA: hypothetical protein PLR25_12485 [Planctomycetaceae bacterium]|nr:hypothetical protein [Planctomycetaceae bacterium]